MHMWIFEYVVFRLVLVVVRCTVIDLRSAYYTNTHTLTHTHIHLRTYTVTSARTILIAIIIRLNTG